MCEESSHALFFLFGMTSKLTLFSLINKKKSVLTRSRYNHYHYLGEVLKRPSAVIGRNTTVDFFCNFILYLINSKKAGEV